jgi:hypothetical protein
VTVLDGQTAQATLVMDGAIEAVTANGSRWIS